MLMKTNLLGSAFTTLVGRTDLRMEASVRAATLSQERKMQVQGPPWVTLLRPPSGSLQSFFNSSVRVLNSLRSVQWETSKLQKSSRKMTCRRMNGGLSMYFRLFWDEHPSQFITNSFHFLLPIDELPWKTLNYIIFLLWFFHYTVIKGILKSLLCLPETVPHLQNIKRVVNTLFKKTLLASLSPKMKLQSSDSQPVSHNPFGDQMSPFTGVT